MNEIDSLITAITFSPENLTLRQIIIDKLLKQEMFDRVVEQCCEGLQYTPNHAAFLVPLAQSYLKLWKIPQALVITELLIKEENPQYKILHAQALYQQGDILTARKYYQEAIDNDSSLEIPEWTQKLSANGNSPEMRMIAGGEHASTTNVEPERPEFNFQNVGGMDAIKENIRMKIIYPLQNAGLFAAYGKKAGGGVLL